MDKFWELDIYNSNTDNIHNNKIYDIINSINKLKKNSSNTIFNINDNLQLEIIDIKMINKEINKIKKDNINYLKTHVECIPEYFRYINNIVIADNNDNKLNFIDLNDKEIEQDENILDYYDLLYNIEDFYEEFKSKLIYEDSINEKILIKLKQNLKQIEFVLKEIIDTKKKIILLDGENILKSFKIQHVLKNIIGSSEFNKYFDKWIYGDFNQINPIDCSMSISEYSKSINYIEPFNSIGLNLNEKNYLINIILSNYLNNYFIIYFLNTKHIDTDIDNNVDTDKLQYILTNNSLFLPIIYNKNDIREQDDHLLIFLYAYLSKYLNTIIISGDKFKFYNDNIPIKSLNLLYDCDNNKINLIISEQYSTDLIKINNSIYTTSLFFPNIYIGDFIKLKEQYYESFDITNIIKLITNKYLEYLIQINNQTNSLNTIDIKNIIILINQTIKIISQINFKFKIVFNYLESNSKKEIFKSIIDNNNNLFTNEFTNNFKSQISKFKIIIKIYLIFKSFKQLYSQTEFTNKLSKLFSLIIWNYDKIDISIQKIRKLSNKNSQFNIMFLEISSIYLYIKKIGLCKK